MSIPKAKTIFDLLNDLTFNKVPWSAQTDSDKKTFQTYMVQRWLSMNYDYLELIADVQPLTNSLSPEQFYTFYLDALPKKKTFFKYISNKNKEAGKHSELVKFLSEIHKGSISEMEDNVELLLSLPNGKETIIEELNQYGFDSKEIKKRFNI